MVFGFLRRKKQAPPQEDPLLTFDQALASVARQGQEVRRSAATLLAIRAELQRDRTKQQTQLDELTGRASSADLEPRVAHTLTRDREQVARLLTKTQEALAQAEQDAQLLLEVAERLAREHAELEAERQSAKVRLSAGALVSDALRGRVASFERLMKLDAARDEVERAHALAELYRDDAGAPR